MIKEQQSLGQLFSELSAGTSALIRQEVQLAKVELTQKANKAGKDVALIAAGGVVAYGGFLVLLAALVLVLAVVMPLWLAAFLVGSVVAGIGALVALNGWESLQKTTMTPERTIKSLQEDKEWLQHQLN
ncbi:MAG TPA: phage holin family protein [Anaerolineae bacterium]|nr:phage holin family protein [Anaerolineae bacterium]MCB0181227.1 phage holin family protein [Anaerolineae bacterium]MCB0224934.1 phage holin family protein [Anaerolineae bacterium]MCB9103866.1 phage holin family protein [Anaerolineales bacterium]HRV93556.1 phage holin family protein [Anaerolineae bacterium]